ncbi:MAG: hypothetical protein ACO1TE_08175 [Prosthecobacter sp.]
MADASSLVVVTPYALREWADRPRRCFDPAPLPPGGTALVGAWFDDDEQVEREYHRRRSGPFRRMVAAVRLLIRGQAALRRARMIYCLDGMHYALLLMLSQNGWFPTEGKIIRRYVFHDKAWQNLSARLRTAAPAFQLELITHEQFASAAGHLGAGRVVFRPWKIDTAWFKPEPEALHLRALLPGNASRDESLVPPLLHRGISITRVGRLESLAARYAAEVADPRFELVTNASHREYLAHLHAAPAVLLPILPCDDSAGLTAAMEAMAAGIPILANRSTGLTELFAACQYPVPMVNGLDPDTWARAYHRLEEDFESPGFLNQLDVSRRLLIERHALLPPGQDWAHIFHTACAGMPVEFPATALSPAPSPEG